MIRALFRTAAVMAGVTLIGCGPQEPEAVEDPVVDAGTQEVPEPAAALGTGDGSPNSVNFTLIATSGDGLKTPRDLAFNPKQPDELWIVNADDDSTTIVYAASQDNRVADWYVDAYALHFMDNPSSIAFGADPTTIDEKGTFATCQESRNTYNGPGEGDDFMGPALWSSDLSVYAQKDPYGLGSHLDMLHGSPNCMGIAHERDNVYWVFGGKAHTGSTFKEIHLPAPAIVKYDFGADHGVGADDHSDGEIYQYATNEVSYVAGVPSHLIFDPSNALLYIADTGNARVAALDTTSGTLGRALQGQEPLVAYYMMEDEILGDVVPASSGLLMQPSGIELHEGLLYVSDHATGIIHAFDKEGTHVKQLDTGLGAGALAGMAFGPDGKLYFVDMKDDQVLRIDPK